MNVSYDAYRVFYYVAQCRSFTKAAAMLYSNQPNVTRTIKHLEETLGCPLFVRTSRSVQLTPEGEALLTHIAPAIEHIQAGESAVLHSSSLHGGVIRIGTSEIALHRILLPVLKDFRRDYPEVRLQIYNSNTVQAVSALKERQVDFSLVTLPIDVPEYCEKTDLTQFQEVPVCGSAYGEFAARTMTLVQMASLPLISLCKGTSTYQLYTAWFREHRMVFSPDIEAATSDQILPMVRANLGIGFIPEYAAKQAVRDGSVSILRLQAYPPVRTICMLKRTDHPLSIAAGTLETMLLQYSPAGLAGLVL